MEPGSQIRNSTVGTIVPTEALISAFVSSSKFASDDLTWAIAASGLVSVIPQA